MEDANKIIVLMEHSFMTLDEAIQHCEERGQGCTECANEHLQLAEWLKELKMLREWYRKWYLKN